MRYSAILLIVVAGIPSAVVAGPPSFPYTAYVNAESVYVRSGPGEDYYPTSKLAVGQPVEIYRHDPGGWCAIKPPEGSYTWVSSRYLTPADGGLARITGSRVAARVGTAFNDTREVIQVRLDEGEVVELLPGQPPLDGPGEKPAWYKIMPPSGEFRWVFGKYVDRNDIYNGVRKPHSADVVAASAVEELAEPTDPMPAAADTAPAAGGEPLAEHDPHNGAIATEDEQFDSDRRWQVAAAPAAQSPAASEGVAAGAAQPAAEVLPADYRGISPEEFQAEVDDVELRIATLLSKEPASWQFAALVQRCERLLAQSQTALERGQAQRLCDKLARLEDLQQRYQAIQIARHEVGALGLPATQLAQRPRGDTLRVAAAPAGRYDGTGQLVERPHPETGAASYALVEPTGELRCYVTPAPGVNLQHYVGQQVGVVGVRGGNVSATPQVIAKHVEVLETKVR